MDTNNDNQDIGSRVYVANLNYDLKEEELREFFGRFGEVTKANIVQSYEDSKDAQKAIAKGNDAELMERKIVVREALPSRPKGSYRNDSGFSRGGGRGGYNNRSGYRGGGRGGYNNRSDRADGYARQDNYSTGNYQQQQGGGYDNGPANNNGY
ncbi:hypothetical protein H4R20_000145 [Coemansia guatemalensis]|uniref:RRM domain-containing protein n=1 Tax=Coemansia guatemalensis TaxID=2761395 RepID=A0A9W8I8C0_9FUNG|nr:hypothetical protein H4R20_000145 [Coemansia guatemalensis]